MYRYIAKIRENNIKQFIFHDKKRCIIKCNKFHLYEFVYTNFRLYSYEDK